MSLGQRPKQRTLVHRLLGGCTDCPSHAASRAKAAVGGTGYAVAVPRTGCQNPNHEGGTDESDPD